METAKGHKATKMWRNRNHPTIKNFFRLRALLHINVEQKLPFYNNV